MNASSSPESVEASGLDRTGNDLDVGTTGAGNGAGRELASSDYHVGAARAQGPDPYARFDNDHETPANIRHFPKRDHERGDDLKLSGLLGPSARDDSMSEDVQSDSSVENASDTSDEHSTTARSSDDSE